MGKRAPSEETDKQFTVAGGLFEKAYKLNSKNPPIVANWSVYYFYIGQYKKAEEKADEAIKMGYRFSPDYMNDLKKILSEQ